VHLNSVFNFVLLTFASSINLVTGKASKFHKCSHILQKYIFVTIISIKHTYLFWGYLCSGMGGFKRKIALQYNTYFKNLLHHIHVLNTFFSVSSSFFYFTSNRKKKKKKKDILMLASFCLSFWVFDEEKEKDESVKGCE